MGASRWLIRGALSALLISREAMCNGGGLSLIADYTLYKLCTAYVGKEGVCMYWGVVIVHIT